jgi:beta-galactosidase
VAEYGRKAVPEERPLDLTLDGATVRAEEWYEILDPADGTEVVARWANRHPAGSPAITRRPLGKGAVYYVGAYLHDALFGALLPRLAEESGLAPLLAPHPEGLEATVRTDGARELWFLVNRGEDPVAVEEAPAGRDLLADAPAGGRIELAPHEAVVIERDPTA